jgi:hypothetical protein
MNPYRRFRTVIRLEAAVTRTIILNKVALPQKPYSSYAAAWASEEVRGAWLRRTETTVQMMNNIVFVVGNTRLHDFLGADDSIQKLQGMLRHIESEALQAKSSPSGRAAGQLDGELSKASSMTVEVVTNLSNAIRDARGWISSTYRVWFGIGSLLLLVGRFLDWWKETHLPTS